MCSLSTCVSYIGSVHCALQDYEQKFPEFASFRRRQEELPVMNGLKLNALLITPVQRIPR